MARAILHVFAFTEVLLVGAHRVLEVSEALVGAPEVVEEDGLLLECVRLGENVDRVLEATLAVRGSSVLEEIERLLVRSRTRVGDRRRCAEHEPERHRGHEDPSWA